MYSLEDIMNQALEDKYAMVLDSDEYSSRMVYGCKISRDNESGNIEILNTARGGDWYLPLTDQELQHFLEKGWRIGVYELSLSNYRTKLDKIEAFIKKEMNGRRNPKQIQSLKSSREKVMNSYSKIKNKLNQISNAKIKNRKHQG